VRSQVIHVRALYNAMIQGGKRLVLELEGLKVMVLQQLAQEEKYI
jgi:hypothetical protein